MEKLKATLTNWFQEPLVGRLLAILIGTAVILLITYFIKRSLKHTIKSNDNKYRARKAVNVFGYLLIVSVVLFVYSDKLGNIGVALGVAGAGIAFALQEVIISIAGWFSIIIGGIVGVGQRIKVGDVKGDIIDIGVMNTTVMEIGDWVDGDLYNGCIVTIANSFVFKEKVHNYSAEYPFLWDEIIVPLRTESDYQLARKVFTNLLNEVCGLSLGDINGIPRVLDAGQCNDSYSWAFVALKLKEVLKLDDINKLPIVFNIAWYEQKAIIVHLALLYLGIKNTHIGPTLPGFMTPNVLKVVQEKFGVQTITTVEEDMKNFNLN